MSEEVTTTGTADVTQTEVEKEAFLERLNKESSKRKEAEKQSAQFQKDLADLRAQMDERETAGLPELDRERKRAEQLEKRAAEAEQKAAQADAKLARTAKERWVSSAAKDFQDPEDASAFVNLDDIEDEKDAERAVKQLAKRKPHLLKAESPKLPGRVLANGQAATTSAQTGGIDVVAEADQLSQSLAQFLKNRRA